MFQIDKRAFGSFIAGLRRERKMTQRDLASKLYISDKAVSKWETGMSLPDISLLPPLAEALGVSVAELLDCRRMDAGETLDLGETDRLLRRALEFEPAPARSRPTRGQVAAIVLAVLTAAAETAILLGPVSWRPSDLTIFALLEGFGLLAWAFTVLTVTRLPAYYDENRIDYFTNYVFRIHMAGVSINNRNWPYILRAIRRWSVAETALSPAFFYALDTLAGPTGIPRTMALLVYILGGLLVPAYAAAIRHGK